MARREFQFQEGAADKFWAIELAGKSFTVTFGRRGTAGQTQTKDFASSAEALKACEKLIAEKVKKGYQEAGAAESSTGAETTAATQALATKTPKTSKGKKGTATAETPHASARAPSAPDAGPAPPARPVSTDVTRRLHLTTGETYLKTGASSERGKPQPFDRASCLERLGRVIKITYRNGWDWGPAEIPEAMTEEEADFWLRAMLKESWNTNPRAIARELKEYAFKKPLALKELRGLKEVHMITPLIMAPISQILSAEEIFDWIADLFAGFTNQSHLGWDAVKALLLVEGFSRYVRPYLADKELKALRKRVADAIDLTAPWPDHYHPLPFEYYMAAALGMTKETQQIVARMTESSYGKQSGWSDDYYQRPQFLVLRLGNPAQVEAEMRRIKLLLRGADQIREWLAVTEWNALDVVRDSILDISKREEVEILIERFGAAIEAPEAAPVMLELKMQSKAPALARQWLEEHLGCAIAGLVSVAAGKGKLAEAALDFLREKKRQGHADLIGKLLKGAPAEAASRVREEVLEREEKIYEPLDEKSTPSWFTKAVADLKPPKPSAWLPLDSLPPIVIGERRLNQAQVGLVVAALERGMSEKPPAAIVQTSRGTLLPALKQHADDESLDAFAWAVFDHWLGSGAPSKDRWGLMAIGFLGGDRSVLKLTPLVRAWPGESQHQRAVLGLECLRRVGSDTALMQLNGIAQKLKFKGLKEAAGRFMEEIAKDKGLTRTQLEDRIVPDCDLDERGARAFDFGPRQFRFVLGPQLKPMIKDQNGAVKTDLPKPNAKDDAEKANQAIADWKLLKKQVAEVAKIQAVRLEQAMVTGRRWPAPDFQTLLVRHPLMINLVRLLLWAVYDAKGKVTRTFRVTEDQSLADAKDKEIKLAATDQVGIAHPLQLSEEDKSAWGELFSDYEILPPFAQLGRPIYTLEAQEEKAKEITRFGKVKLPGQTLVFGLEKLGWTRGPAMDNGTFDEHVKHFPGSDVTALVKFQGLPIGWMEGWEDQTIEHCFFLPGQEKATCFRYFANEKRVLKLKDVDPVVFSEVLSDLAGIAAKGK